LFFIIAFLFLLRMCDARLNSLSISTLKNGINLRSSDNDNVHVDILSMQEIKHAYYVHEHVDQFEIHEQTKSQCAN
jgi:hypothetical protein